MKEAAGRILMMVENYFPQDTRVKNEADLLTNAGYHVSVIALQEKGQPRREIVSGIEVYRVPHLELFKKTPPANLSRATLFLLKLRASLGYLMEYCYFTVACLLVTSYVFGSRGLPVILAYKSPESRFGGGRPL